MKFTLQSLCVAKNFIPTFAMHALEPNVRKEKEQPFSGCSFSCSFCHRNQPTNNISSLPEAVKFPFSRTNQRTKSFGARLDLKSVFYDGQEIGVN